MPPKASEPYLTDSAPFTTSIEPLLFWSISGAWSSPHCCPVCLAPLLTMRMRLPYMPLMTGLATDVPVCMELTPLTCSRMEARDLPIDRSMMVSDIRLLTLLTLVSRRSPVTTTSPMFCSLSSRSLPFCFFFAARALSAGAVNALSVWAFTAVCAALEGTARADDSRQKATYTQDIYVLRFILKI